MKVNNTVLFLLAGSVWCIAGFNVLHIGLISYQAYETPFYMLISCFIFLCFWFFVFRKLVKKHSKRIGSYGEEKQYFYYFFDKKSFIIMVMMMSIGIAIRTLHLWSDKYIAIFYTGLGAALLLAGIAFFFSYARYKNE